MSSEDPCVNLISISRNPEGRKLIQLWCFEVEPLEARPTRKEPKFEAGLSYTETLSERGGRKREREKGEGVER